VAEERQGLLAKRHGSKFVEKKEEGAAEKSAEGDADADGDGDVDGEKSGEAAEDAPDAADKSDQGPPGFDTGLGGRRMVPLTLNRRSFFPREWRSSDGFCPPLSRHNPKLGHVKNCSMSMRREPHGGELVSEVSIKGFLQRKDDTIKADLLTREEERRRASGGGKAAGGAAAAGAGAEGAEAAGSPGVPHRLAMHFRPELTGHLPHTDRRFRFSSCAVVGNSGSLDGAGLGRSIDSRGAVIRMNMAPVEGHQAGAYTRSLFSST